MTTANDVLEQARARLGWAEQPQGSNNVPGITDWYGMRGAWCAMFVSRCLYDAGFPVPASTSLGFAWVSAGFDFTRRQGWNFTNPRDAAPADLVAFEYGDGYASGGYDHIEIVESNRPDLGGLVTIGGNVGDRVGRFFRAYDGDGIRELARLPFDGTSPAPAPVEPGAGDLTVYGVNTNNRAPYVRTIQTLVGVAIDGVFGLNTAAAVSRWQTALGIEADGVWGPITQAASEQLLQWLGTQGVAPTPTVAIDPQFAAELTAAVGTVLRLGAQGGSVKIAQVGLNIKGAAIIVDGIFGPATDAATRAVQAAAGIAVDGVIGPDTWRVLVS